ncbi:unnamed protein product [Symbiodinium natans]|uniref:Uncharacterized protein n=1 Tax=Symbiodinium natans TaxID=878477 RepID=A0A812Q841_9DINO|nr:unnamed protein product [Symbiodinium natans]
MRLARRGRAVCQDIAEQWDVSIDIASVRKKESARRLAQKARVTANEWLMVAALRLQARSAPCSILQRANAGNWRTNPAASALQRRPASRASTMRRERAESSGTCAPEPGERITGSLQQGHVARLQRQHGC